VGLGVCRHWQRWARLLAGALALDRLLSGAAVLAVIALGRRVGWPPRAAWLGIVVTGVLWFGVYMVALNWGEQHVDAGTAAVVVNIGPILIALLGGWLLGEGLPRPLMPSSVPLAESLDVVRFTDELLARLGLVLQPYFVMYSLDSCRMT
jgi:hypothetical protein